MTTLRQKHNNISMRDNNNSEVNVSNVQAMQYPNPVRSCHHVQLQCVCKAVDLRRGSSLSPGRGSFLVILNAITSVIQEKGPRCMLFAYDIMLAAESGPKVQTGRMAATTEECWFESRQQKTENLQCNSGGLLVLCL